MWASKAGSATTRAGLLERSVAILTKALGPEHQHTKLFRFELEHVFDDDPEAAAAAAASAKSDKTEQGEKTA